MPNNIQPPRDAAGNIIHEGDLVSLVTGKHLLCKVQKVQDGGLHTNQGMTPCVVILEVKIALTGMPGVPMHELIRIVSPQSEEAVKKVLESVS